MNYSSGAYNTGAIFTYPLSGLAAGNYTYYFVARDSLGAQLKSTPLRNGPAISGPNTAPQLSWIDPNWIHSDGIEPQSGGVNTSFGYRIKYTDQEGDTPEYIKFIF